MADLLTATVDATFAQVILRIEFTEPGTTDQVTALVERSDDGGLTWAAVRGGDRKTLVGPSPAAGNYIGYLVDTEMPLNTAVMYRANDYINGIASASPIASTPTSVTVTVADGVAWLKDPARPWANLRIDPCPDGTTSASCGTVTEPAIFIPAGGLGTEGYEGDFTLFPILNSPRPADVYAYRKDVVTSWRVISKTLLSMNSLETFYAWGGPIFIQLPTAYGWPDRYYQPARVEVSRLSTDLRKAYRLWDVPLTAVNAPVGAAQGTVQNNWCAVDSIYGTYAGLLATGLTWGNVQEGSAVPPSVLDGYGFGPYGSGPYGDGG